MAMFSTLARIRQAGHLDWSAELRHQVRQVGQRCLDRGHGIEAVLLFGSRARGDGDGHS